jgi:hypothetical protein
MKKGLLLSAVLSVAVFIQAQNVGVGNNNPLEKLHVDLGNIKIGMAQWSSAANSSFLKFGDGDFITIGEDEADDRLLIKTKNVIFKPSSTAYKGYVGIGTNYVPNSPLEIYSPTDAAIDLPGLRLTSPQGFNIPSKSWNLYSYYGGPVVPYLFFAFEGANRGYIDGNTGSYFNISDKNLKKNITYLQHDALLGKIMQLAPASYFMNSDSLNSKLLTGFISQDVEKIFPELVSETRGVKMMNYSGLIPILTKGIQEQQQQITNLEKENETIKKELAELRKMILSNQ